MAKLYSECTVHVHCAKNASIYTMNYFGDLETSLVSKYTPLFFLFAEIHFSACFLHVHVFCINCAYIIIIFGRQGRSVQAAGSTPALGERWRPQSTFGDALWQPVFDGADGSRRSRRDALWRSSVEVEGTRLGRFRPRR